MMRILVIGGTQFAGRALTEAALAHGHELTLFHRGQTNPNLFPEVTTIHGDRDGDIEKLGTGQWDVVIDTCGYVPRVVQQSARYLADKVKRYVFISTISVYAVSPEIHRDETAPVAILTDPSTEAITGETYGGLKVLCEQAVEAALPGRTLIIRPGLIIGPHDPTNRFTYWPVRIRKGGDVLIPGSGDSHIQFIDVHDLADFMLTLIEAGAAGIYNATGPEYALTLHDVLETCKQVTDSSAQLVPVPADYLQEQEVGAWMEMPLWTPDEPSQALMQISVQKSIDAGLTFRPLQDTIAATLEWYDSIDGDSREWPAGMQPAREQELLASWAASSA